MGLVQKDMAAPCFASQFVYSVYSVARVGFYPHKHDQGVAGKRQQVQGVRRGQPPPNAGFYSLNTFFSIAQQSVAYATYSWAL